MAEAPDDPEIYELEQWLRKADAVGDAHGARSIIAEIEKRKNPSWSQLPSNIIPDAANLAAGVVEMVKHPIDTAKGAAVGAYRLATDPDARAGALHEIDEAVGSPAALKRTIIKHPVSAALTVSPGVAGAVKYGPMAAKAAARATSAGGGALAPLRAYTQTPVGDAMLQAARGIKKIPEQLGVTDPSPVPTSATLRAEAKRNYTAVDNSPVRISPESFQAFADDLPSNLEGFETDIPELSPKASAVVKKLQNYLTEDDTLKFSKLDRLRQAINKAEATPDANDARLLGDIKDQIDEYVDAIDDTHLDFGEADDLDAVRADISQARNAWGRNAKMRRIEEIKEIASLQTHPDLYIRQRFTAITRKPRLYKQYTPAERNLITKLAKHGTLGQLGRAAPHFTPAGLVKGAIYTGAGTTPIGAPIAASIAATSMAAFHGAEVLRKSRMDNLLKEIAEERAKVRAGLRRGRNPSQRGNNPQGDQ